MMELHNIRQVAIYDDQPDHRESLAEVIEDANFDPIKLDEPYSTMDDCVKGLQEYDAAVLDQRLSPGNFGNYRGAEVVRELYLKRFPALLITAWAYGDPEDIQPFRRQIPCLIPKGKVESDQIRDGFQSCINEFNEEFSSKRRPTRTIVRIASDFAPAARGRVEAFVPAWNPQEGVTFPLEVVPAHLHDYLRQNVRFFVDVNTGADSQDELFFENFQIATEASDEFTYLLRR